MAKRYTATFKVSGTNSTQGRQQNSVFFWMDDDTTDEDATTAAQSIATLCNGMLTSVTKQIYVDALADVGPYPAATANGGSDRARLLFRNSSRHTEQITIPFLKHTIEKAEIEAVFEVATFLNRDGEALGQLVNIQQSQVVDG